MKNELYVVARYRGYFKLIGLPFRPMKDDKIIDKEICMTVDGIIINKDIEEGIMIYVTIANASYNDQEDLYMDMTNKGWRKG